ncbi:hypothetical protein [Streptomyces avermitilis]|uniref:hypothetical protein n=1 Tax=Streptomyces avermitilis TaxID=33903 RepID=UPI0033A8A421
MATLDEVRAFVRDLPNTETAAAVQEAATSRPLELDAAQRPVITPGRTGQINSGIRPACLRRLTGTIQQPNRTNTRFDFLLTEEATTQLRHRLDPDNPRFKIPEGVTWPGSPPRVSSWTTRPTPRHRRSGGSAPAAPGACASPPAWRRTATGSDPGGLRRTGRPPPAHGTAGITHFF